MTRKHLRKFGVCLLAASMVLSMGAPAYADGSEREEIVLSEEDTAQEMQVDVPTEEYFGIQTEDANDRNGTDDRGNADDTEDALLAAAPEETVILDENGVPADGTYSVSVTVENGGMFNFESCYLVVNGGEMNAVATLKGSGFDRLYVGKNDSYESQTICIEANQQPDSELIAYAPDADGAYQFWPIPVKELDKPVPIAARSHRHFHNQDSSMPWYDHPVTFLSRSLEKISDETTMLTPEKEAEQYICRNYLDGTLLTGENADLVRNGVSTKQSFSVPYYDKSDNVIMNLPLRIPGENEYRYGWFIDEAYKDCFAASTWEKTTYPSQITSLRLSNAARRQGAAFSLTLRLYDPETNYSDIDNQSVAALAECTFSVSIRPSSALAEVYVQVVDKKRDELIETASVQILDVDGKTVQPEADGSWSLDSGKQYSLQVSAEGYRIPGGEAIFEKSLRSPASQTILVEMLREDEVLDTVHLVVKDQFGQLVPDPLIQVWRNGATTPPEADGSFRLYDSQRYSCTVETDGYVRVSSYSVEPTQNEQTFEILQQKLLDTFALTLKVYARSDSYYNKNYWTMDEMDLKVMKGDEEILPEEDGRYIVEADTDYQVLISRQDYAYTSVRYNFSGSEYEIEREISVERSERYLLGEEIRAAQDFCDSIVESELPGEYMAGTKVKLQEYIDRAEAVFSSEDSTEDECRSAKNTLSRAVSATKLRMNACVADLQVQVNAAGGELPIMYRSLHVTGDDADQYGYEKDSQHVRQVTLVDVLAAVHRDLYGDAFAETPKKYMQAETLIGMTSISYLFGKKTNYKVEFYVNDKSVEMMSCTKKDLADGDKVVVFIHQGYSDYCLRADNWEQTRETGEEFRVQLINRSSMGAEVSAEGYTVELTNEEGDSITAVSDADGVLNYRAEKTGLYKISEVIPPKDMYLGWPYVEITITESTTPADYSKVDEALAKVPSDEELKAYTDESVKALKAAVEAAENADRDLTRKDQDQVDALADAIEKALAGLTEKPAPAVPADYSKVDAALKKVPKDLSGYTKASADALKKAVAAVKRGLNSEDQAKVDKMASDIEAAIKGLKKDLVTMYRLYNPNSGEHFYTGSAGEKNALVKAGWKDEGIAWYAPKTSKIPVYRLYNPNAGDHHYTTNAGEKNALVKVGWKYEGIGWYSCDEKEVTLYRLYNPNAKGAGAHHYTTNAGEKKALVKLGWKDEGIAWYGCKQ